MVCTNLMRERVCNENSGQRCRWEDVISLTKYSVRVWTEDREVGQFTVVVRMNFGVWQI